jgi:hypothetical protein
MHDGPAANLRVRKGSTPGTGKAACPRDFGFTGQVDYLHAFTDSGGAQYRRGRDADQDLLVVYAKAFLRDATPDDFSLEAIIAHERGHQLLVRHPRLARMTSGKISIVGDEFLASLLGSLLAQSREDRENLVGKAVFEAVQAGTPFDVAQRLAGQIRSILEQLL